MSKDDCNLYWAPPEPMGPAVLPGSSSTGRAMSYSTIDNSFFGSSHIKPISSVEIIKTEVTFKKVLPTRWYDIQMINSRG